MTPQQETASRAFEQWYMWRMENASTPFTRKMAAMEAYDLARQHDAEMMEAKDDLLKQDLENIRLMQVAWRMANTAFCDRDYWRDEHEKIANKAITAITAHLSERE